MRFVFGSSGMLAQQIENGAPYDLFLSADEALVHGLAAHGRVQPASVTAYATGRLGLWSAEQRLKSVEELSDARFRIIAIANPRHAPYGAAAQALLTSLGLWTGLQPRLVLAENVRQAYEFAATGNADAALASWTLLHDKPGALQLSASLHPPIRQSGAIVTSTARAAEARAFLAFLIAPSGQAILQAGGLYPPGMAPASPGH